MHIRYKCKRHNHFSTLELKLAIKDKNKQTKRELLRTYIRSLINIEQKTTSKSVLFSSHL